MSLLGKKRSEQTISDEESRNEEENEGENEGEQQAPSLPPPPLVTVGPRTEDQDLDHPTERGAPEDQER